MWESPQSLSYLSSSLSQLCGRKCCRGCSWGHRAPRPPASEASPNIGSSLPSLLGQGDPGRLPPFVCSVATGLPLVPAYHSHSPRAGHSFPQGKATWSWRWEAEAEWGGPWAAGRSSECPHLWKWLLPPWRSATPASGASAVSDGCTPIGLLGDPSFGGCRRCHCTSHSVSCQSW